MYPLLIFSLSVWILIATTTSDAYVFWYEQVVQFSFEASPNFMDLLITSDIELTSQFYIIQKTGHMLTFALLYSLYFYWWKRAGIAFLVTSLFAIFTEILQLYFNRNGRLFDVGIDLVGIIIAYYLCGFVTREIGHRKRRS
ncbi:VanZ family protein [Bacillus sp. FJAT-22090]|uniref:VanZ family protein n=1 Tax=Bacillus sp. FJAT-22090 TaxID=1581038 RepID=UPI0021B1FE50|nr:VanZ family protein [Bacillus sp. FJAT-22090]